MHQKTTNLNSKNQLDIKAILQMPSLTTIKNITNFIKKGSYWKKTRRCYTAACRKERLQVYRKALIELQQEGYLPIIVESLKIYYLINIKKVQHTTYTKEAIKQNLRALQIILLQHNTIILSNESTYTYNKKLCIARVKLSIVNSIYAHLSNITHNQRPSELNNILEELKKLIKIYTNNYCIILEQR